MALKVIVYQYPESRRSVICGQAMSMGISSVGDYVEVRNTRTYTAPEADVAVFYGLSKPVLQGYSSPGHKAVFIDLGYWAREGQEGHHKIVVNSRHPTSYFQKRKHSADRFKRLGIAIKPWRTNERGSIMVVGMSAKAAAAEGLRPEQWETETINQLRKLTKRTIVYRPKPNWNGSQPIVGAVFQRGDQQGRDVRQVLQDTYAVVTHHSNVGVDAVLEGVPVISVEGIASVMGCSEITSIDGLMYPDNREQWAHDAAYTQWTVTEMRTGAAWRHLKDEGLVP
jgi:hypothetical protein